MKLDLGAIAKGFAVDVAVKKLKELGVNSCLINAGGEIYCLGRKHGKPWKVGVKHPRSSDMIEYLELENKAVATSGDYEQFFLLQDTHYSHIIDPRTGCPADSGIVSVTVIADDCLTADALATSIFILGKTDSRELIKNFSNIKTIIFNEVDLNV